jgi:hypothetical protein
MADRKLVGNNCALSGTQFSACAKSVAVTLRVMIMQDHLAERDEDTAESRTFR